MSKDSQGWESPSERRWSQRRSAVLTVEIYRTGALVGTCHTRDVGLGGAFIACAEELLTKGADCDVVFRLGDELKMRHRLRARVVRSGRDGIGVTFRDFDTRAFRALQEIMRHVPKSANESNPGQAA